MKKWMLIVVLMLCVPATAHGAGTVLVPTPDPIGTTAVQIPPTPQMVICVLLFEEIDALGAAIVKTELLIAALESLPKPLSETVQNLLDAAYERHGRLVGEFFDLLTQIDALGCLTLPIPFPFEP